MVALTGGYAASPLTNVSAIAHITGGGIPGKLGRSLLPANCGALLTDLFDPCPIMLHCQDLAEISDKEAYSAWNMGNGLMVVVSDPDVVINEAVRLGYEAKIAGEIQSDPQIRINSKGRQSSKQEWLIFPS